jgi:hypothetical protein
MSKKLRLGLILDPEYYLLGKAVCALTPPLIDAFIRNFDTRILYSQERYDALCTEVDLLISHEPDWAAPRLRWNRAGRFRRSLPRCPTYVMMSDPHGPRGRDEYFQSQGLDFILGYYLHPTRHHFPWLGRDQLVHYPWAVPDAWMDEAPIAARGQDYLAIFGASAGPAYDTRNWCRNQPGVRSFDHSGCENKLLSDRDFFRWLGTHDAVIAAGSLDPSFRLTTPKYFEAAAVGALLFAQETDDLTPLGFAHQVNCVAFNQDNFAAQAADYLRAPGDPRWAEIRAAGRQLIRQRHTISRRIDDLVRHLHTWRGRGVGPVRNPATTANLNPANALAPAA